MSTLYRAKMSSLLVLLYMYLSSSTSHALLSLSLISLPLLRPENDQAPPSSHLALRLGLVEKIKKIKK